MKTKQELLGYVFGNAIQSFDNARPPKMYDIVRYWMHHYDQTREFQGIGADKKMSETLKDSVINDIVDNLILIWQNLSRSVDEKGYVKKTVKHVITEAAKFEKLQKYKDNPDKIKEYFERFNKICNLAPATPTKKNSKPSVISTEQISPLLNTMPPTDLGKRNITLPKRLIENYPPVAKKAKLDITPIDNVINNSDDIKIDHITDDESDDNEIDNVTNTDNEWVYDDSGLSDDEDEDYEVPSNCMYDYSEAIKFGVSHRLSIRVITGMINSSVKCVGITESHMHLSCAKVRHIIKKLGIQIRKVNSEKNSNLQWIGVDGRNDIVALPNNKTGSQENVSIINVLTGKYADHVIPIDHSARTLAKEIYNFLIKSTSDESLFGISMDNCPTNTGGGKKEEGAIYFLEHEFLKRALMRSIGLLHLNELLMRHFMIDNCGFITSGPYSFADPLGKIVKALKDNLKEIADFPPIPTNLPNDIPEDLLKNNDQQYMYKILMAISHGWNDLLFDLVQFVYKHPGNIGHARWLTQLLNCARLYVQMKEPARCITNEMGINTWKYNKLKRVVTFGSQAYGPNFFKIKMHPDIKNASQHFLDMIKLSKSVCTEDEFEDQKKVFINNGHSAHPEMILYWAIRGTECRKKAVDLILDIRKRTPKDFVRKYMVPRDYINFDADTPWELLGDLRKLPENFLSEPALTKIFSDEQLMAYADGETELEFPSIPCHNVSIEKSVKQTSIASKKGTSHDDVQSYLLHTQERLDKVPTDFNKSHFKD